MCRFSARTAKYKRVTGALKNGRAFTICPELSKRVPTAVMVKRACGLGVTLDSSVGALSKLSGISVGLGVKLGVGVYVSVGVAVGV